MIRITEFSNPRMAQAFVDYMATKGIFLQLEPDGHCTILLEDESVLPQVEHELAIFILDPLHPRYQAASWQSGKTSHRITYPRTALWLNIRERAGPVTMTVMLICILVFLAMQVMGSREVIQWLSWPAAAMQDFQIWRWVSHAFIHFSLLHIVFNLMWWWYLGGAVEKRLGSGKLLVIAIISALLSGGLQARFSGAGFGGLSGVVYALMGYCWLRGERDPQSGVYLERGLIVFALIWLVAGYYGLFGMALANMAHLAGLLTGLTMAWVDSQSALKKRR